MTPERLRAAEPYFLHALDLAPAERQTWLAGACSHDEELRSDVERLLGADEGGETWLGAAVAEEADWAAEGVAPGARIGAYRVERRIGNGGMGVVYLATRADEQYEKRVAIKVLRLGLGGIGARELFLRERQILAQLDHPYIARLLDGGTLGAGQPYLVLDYIEGLPVPDFCRRRGATQRERIELFLKICEGVSYAHRNLVVHRDLKPGNILVTAEGVPKLLDFGIAKLLGASGRPSNLTEAPTGLMTPRYASPEQLRGSAITTATDVYSLGMILYEMLAGAWPYDVEGLSISELSTRILSDPVERPSRRKIPGLERIPADLDNITLKALDKDPERRYRSADELASDLRRFLLGMPVLARGDSVVYCAGKFIRRRWAPLAAALAVTASLGALALETRSSAAEQTRLRAIAETERSAAEAERSSAVDERRKAEQQAAEAVRQRANADQRFEQVRKLANRFLFDFHDAIVMLPGATPARHLVVTTALEYLDGLVRDKPSDAKLLAEAATAYERVGDVQGNAYYANLGDVAGAKASYEKAMALREKLPLASPFAWRDRILSHLKLGDVIEQQGQTAEAARHYDEAIRLSKRSGISDRVLIDAEAKAFLRRADLNERIAHARDSLADLDRARDLIQRLRALEPSQPRYQSDLALVWDKIGRMRHATGDPAGSIEARRNGIREADLVVQADANNQLFLRSKFVAHLGLGQELSEPAAGKLRDLDEARRQFDEARKAAERIRELDPQNTQATSDAAFAWSYIGLWHEDKEQWPKAVEAHRKALELNELLEKKNPDSRLFRRNAARQRHRLGASMAELPDLEGSLREMRAALAVFDSLAAADPTNTDLSVGQLELLRDIGEVLRLAGKPLDGIGPNLRAAQILQTLIAADPTNKNWPQHLTPIYQQLGECYADAARKTDDALTQRKQWQASRDWFIKAKEAGGPYSGRPVITKGIADAEAAVVKLTAAGPK